MDPQGGASEREDSEVRGLTWLQVRGTCESIYTDKRKRRRKKSLVLETGPGVLM